MKEQLRQKYRQIRRQWADDHIQLKAQYDQSIWQKLSLLISQHALEAPVALYRAHGSEVSLNSGVLSLSHRTFCYPRVVGEGLQFWRPKGPEGPFVKGVFGIEEPDPESSEPVALEDCALAVVPGLAFDRKGQRLGSGKGFYDRTLKAYRGLKVGVAYSLQVSEQDFAREDHDVPMDFVVTEKYILQTQGLSLWEPEMKKGWG